MSATPDPTARLQVEAGHPDGPRHARPSSGLRSWTAVGVVGVVLLVFFAPALGPRTFDHRDTNRMHLPVKEWMGRELAQGRFPQWNPYYGLGTPIVAGAVDAPQH